MKVVCISLFSLLNLHSLLQQTDLFIQVAFQQKLAKKKTLILWLSLSDKCVFGKGHAGCLVFFKYKPLFASLRHYLVLSMVRFKSC